MYWTITRSDRSGAWYRASGGLESALSPPMRRRAGRLLVGLGVIYVPGTVVRILRGLNRAPLPSTIPGERDAASHTRPIETAQKILVVYGVLSLGYGFALGIPISQARMRGPEAPRHLVVAHLSAIIQGAVHLALSVALVLSELTPWLETTGALMLVAGSALFVSGATVNWRQQIGDHFAERSLGWKLLAASSFGHLAGIAVVIVGVLAGL